MYVEPIGKWKLFLYALAALAAERCRNVLRNV